MKLILLLLLFLPIISTAKDVPVINVKTGEVSLIPQETLGPEMVRIKYEEKIYWADSNDLTPNTYQHPVFKGERKRRIEALKSNLKEVYPQTYEEWEDGFRRDKNPDSEISIWEHITKIYLKHSLKTDSLELKKEIFSVALICSYSASDVVLSQANINILSKDKAQKIIRDYYDY